MLSVFGFILTVFGATSSLQSSFNEQFTAFRNEMKVQIEAWRTEIRQNDRRYEDRFAPIENDTRYFCRLVAHMGQVEKLENFPYRASGYLAEIERMNAEVLEYLRQHASETVTAEAA